MAKILIVEDQSILVHLYRSALRQFNHDVVMATDGQGGLEAAQREKFDLIILDLILPGMSGHEVAQRLRESGVLPNVPLIVTTALGEGDAREIADSIGAAFVLNKPFEIGAMINTVRRALVGEKDAPAIRA